jgi:acyl-CoA synthetase (AMP-forming)/AMP-acid ligase II
MLKTAQIQDYWSPTPSSLSESIVVPKQHSILDVLRNAALSRKGIFIPQDRSGHVTRLLYSDILSQAQLDASLLQCIPNLGTKNIFLLHFDNQKENIRWFWAVVFAGYIPCISAPFIKDVKQRQSQIVHLQSLLQTPVILTNERMATEFASVQDLKLYQVDSLLGQFGTLTPNRNNSLVKGEVAALMLTSGSTGNSKAVCLSHAQITQACYSKSQHSGTTSDDTFLNWIGLDHVANLVEMHLHAMIIGADQVQVESDHLLADPLMYLDLINQHRVSITFAPNFFLDLLHEKITSEDPQLLNPRKLDLSSLKACFSGGEANVVQTAINLTRTLSAYGVQKEFIRPGYGLTESCAGITWGRDCPSYDFSFGKELTSVGYPTPGNRIRIMKENGVEALTNEVGDLHLSGSAIFTHYLNNPKATEEAFTVDGWFITGDRAYIDENGRLNMSGRTKEIININGVKYLPHEVELALEQAQIRGMTSSYTSIFSHRPKGMRSSNPSLRVKCSDCSRCKD